MENALFYTLSTIAQSLAAAFALLGAFVLFRLQQISVACAQAAAFVIRAYLPNEEARRLLAVGQFADLARYLATQSPQREAQVSSHALSAARHAFGRCIAQRQALLRQLVQAMLATGAVIVLAVAGLAFTPQLAASALLACATLVVAVVSLAACLVAYGRIIWKATSDA